MDPATILGMLVSFGMIAVVVAADGDFMLFVNVPSMLIVFGGTFGALLTNYPMSAVLSIGGLVRKMLTGTVPAAQDVIDTVMEYAGRARRNGLPSLEENIPHIEDAYLRRGLQLAVDGLEPEVIQSIMETEMYNIEARHETGIAMASSLAAYAPAVGMMGTVIGLVQMLKNMDDPRSIGPSMAVALITTFYGSILANFIFLPMVGKLRHRSKEEITIMEMQMEGVLGIARGENPRVIMEKLNGFQPPGKRRSAR
ncbi:MAG: motility protein A [Desulfovibrio sp.]|jgi:chemotaxis protein MotA|nr:motility protein A [Desulfovibrio sp.]